MVIKKDALPFRIPKNINLVLVDVETGLLPNSKTKKIIYFWGAGRRPPLSSKCISMGVGRRIDTG